jgi:hypothetical protein
MIGDGYTHGNTAHLNGSVNKAPFHAAPLPDR